MHRIDGVMVSVLASCVVGRGFEPRLGQTKDYKIADCCFSGLLQSGHHDHRLHLIDCKLLSP